MSIIGSCNSNFSIAFSCNGRAGGISHATRLRLEALGIDPDTVQTEAQAQELIEQAEAAKRKKNLGQQSNRGGNFSQQELISKAKSLASDVGIKVLKQDSLEGTIEKISKGITALEGNQVNEEKVREYRNRISNLTQEVGLFNDAQQNIFNEMDMISISNKYLLGL